MITLEYNENNSGGVWWLKPSDYVNLKDAGWTMGRTSYDGSTRSASKKFATVEEGIEEWTRITNGYPDAEGCNCCGEPHNFSYTDEDGKKHYSSVEVTQTTRSWD